MPFNVPSKTGFLAKLWDTILLGHSEREVAKQVREPLPGETFALAPTAEPLVPDTLRLFGDPQQTSKIAAHTEVGLHCVSCTACPIVPFGFAPKCPKAADGIHNEWSWAIA